MEMKPRQVPICWESNSSSRVNSQGGVGHRPPAVHRMGWAHMRVRAHTHRTGLHSHGNGAEGISKKTRNSHSKKERVRAMPCSTLHESQELVPA